ncbi:hypothetical protein K491DRAFT_716038 [Lophiostoma macrostomum CBS 122681]|uniref:Uncharacterized protein n=1 Tax=Lophiostoma macrostomum CBS 122681 TaxID=1314788 RepID=A0A6A6T7K9_9PLEO|nr:hypothetical protein K491DRAFT_716038 [Lophiostoma macrostomum CBS 122681]
MSQISGPFATIPTTKASTLSRNLNDFFSLWAPYTLSLFTREENDSGYTQTADCWSAEILSAFRLCINLSDPEYFDRRITARETHLLILAALPRLVEFAQRALRDDVVKGTETEEWTWKDVEERGLEEEFGVIIEDDGTAEGRERPVRIVELDIRFPFVVDHAEGERRVERARVLGSVGFAEYYPEDC